MLGRLCGCRGGEGGRRAGGAQHRDAVLLQGPSKTAVVYCAFIFSALFSENLLGRVCLCHPSSQMAF